MKINVIGGGHVGLPLALFLAKFGKHEVCIVEKNPETHAKISTVKEMLYDEPGFGNLHEYEYKTATSTIMAPEAEAYIVCVPTPVTKNGTPDLSHVTSVLTELYICFESRGGPRPLVVIRSTIPMGSFFGLWKTFSHGDYSYRLVVAPERLAEGKAYEELKNLPQIIGSHDNDEFDVCQEIFSWCDIIEVTPDQAAFMKLATNAYAYANFAIANELSMIGRNYGISFNEMRTKMMEEYPRLNGMPQAGLTAGTCLRKDWRLLTHEVSGGTLFDSAGKVNEDFPRYVADECLQNYGRVDYVVGLGFKPGSTDLRDSLTGSILNYVFLKTGVMPRVIDPLFEPGVYYLNPDGSIWTHQEVGFSFAGRQPFLVVAPSKLNEFDLLVDVVIYAMPYKDKVEFTNSISCW